jgi:hypothetical protein
LRDCFEILKRQTRKLKGRKKIKKGHEHQIRGSLPAHTITSWWSNQDNSNIVVKGSI